MFLGAMSKCWNLPDLGSPINSKFPLHAPGLSFFGCRQALFEQKDQTAVWRWAEAAEAKAAVDVPKVLEALRPRKFGRKPEKKTPVSLSTPFLQDFQ